MSTVSQTNFGTQLIFLFPASRWSGTQICFVGRGGVGRILRFWVFRPGGRLFEVSAYSRTGG